jgi:two-component system response regulator FlrC
MTRALGAGPGGTAVEKLTVLVVEDDEIIREFLTDSLVMKGYDASWVGDGAEALELLEHETVDLILSDVRMPEVDGVTLSHEVKARWPHIPVVLITGVHAKERETILERSAAFACLPKPLRIGHLCEVLEEAHAG